MLDLSFVFTTSKLLFYLLGRLPMFICVGKLRYLGVMSISKTCGTNGI
jgi:hypothetical protein